MSRCIRSLIAISLFVLTVTALCMPVVAADYECPKCGTVFDISEERCPFCNNKRGAVTQEEKRVVAVENAKAAFGGFWFSIAFLVVSNLVYLFLSLKDKEDTALFFINLFAVPAFGFIIYFTFPYVPIFLEHRDLLMI